jgi:uncharacterized protein (DUF2147 family)
MKIWDTTIAIAITIFASLASANTDDVLLGVWNTPGAEAKVEIYRCKDKFCGKLLWLRVPEYPMDDEKEFAGKPKVDRHNPDPARRNEPIIGKEILVNLAQVGSRSWSGGEIYDTKSGNTYRCKATLTDEGKLELRGFIGISLFGRTSVWTR